MENLNVILAAMGITDRDLIESVIGASFFADFGIILSTDQTTVDVRHAIKPKAAGEQLGETVTKKIEVLWPSSTQLSMKWDLAAGDPVLLVGLKDFVRTVASGLPSGTDVPLHYSKETMKAIPMGAYKGDAAIPITVSGGVMQVGDTATMQPVARKTDATKMDVTTDPTNVPFLIAVCAIFGMTLVPPLVGAVNDGSAHVKVGK